MHVCLYDVPVYCYSIDIYYIQDIIKWIILSVGFVIVFIMTMSLSDDDYTGPVINTFLVSRGS